MKANFTVTKYWILALAVAAGLMLPASGKAAPTSCGSSVTSTVVDTDSNSGNPLQFQSDLKGVYVSYGNPKGSQDNVSSAIQGSCDYVLDLSASTSRTIRLTLAYPASAISANPPFTGTENVAARIISICSENTANNGISYGKMTHANQTAYCGLHVAFSYAGQSYALVMDPVEFAGTTWTQATCNGVASTGICDAWTTSPISLANGGFVYSGTGLSSSIGELYLDTKKGQTDIGQFYAAYSITAHE